jgi:replicative DNA helicase
MSTNFASIEAEQSVLGALLVDNSAWDRVADLLQAGDFFRPEHQAIFSAIGSMVNSMKPADVVTVFEELNGRADFGGLSYLNELAQSVIGIGNCRRHAEIVRERAVLRSLLSKIDEAAEVAHGDAKLPDKLDRIAAMFAGIDAGNSRRKPKPMSEIVVKVIDSINEAAEGKQTGWRTSIPGIDWRLNGGLKPGKVIVLAARPSVGKTSLAGQIQKRVASDGTPCLMLSQEMEADEVGERSLANEAMVNYTNIQTGKLNDLEWGQIAESVDRLGHLPLWIDDEPALTMRAIASKARYVKRLGLLVVDYIQLSEGEGDNRTQQVGSITRGLKKLAKELGICVIALSQLNREVDKRPGRRPQMSDLRDSGEIEQDADTIIFLWPMSESEDDAEIRHIGCDFAKNRKGKKGAFVLTFEGAKQLWGESTQTVDSFQTTKKRQGGFE